MDMSPEEMGLAHEATLLSQKPILFNANPQSLTEEADSIAKTAIDIWDKIVSSTKADESSFHTVLLPVIEDENHRLSRSRILCFYASTSPDVEIREASRKAQQILDDLENTLYARQDMFDRFDALLAGAPALDAETAHYLRRCHAKFLRQGAHLRGGAKEELQRLQERMSNLERICRKNLVEDKAGLWLSPAELDGVSKDLIATLRRGKDENEGKLWVTTKIPHAQAVLTDAVSESTRRRIFTLRSNRMLENVSPFRELVLCRDKLARLLGYANYASLMASGKMVETTEVVSSFLENLRRQLVPKGADEVEGLSFVKRDFCEANGLPFDGNLYYWDRPFFTRLADEKQHVIDHGLVSQYFEIGHVLRCLLSIYEHLFDVKFEELDGLHREALWGNEAGSMVWHEDVKLFALRDLRDGNACLGYIYFDLYPRDGKFTHAGSYLLAPVSLSARLTRWQTQADMLNRDIADRMAPAPYLQQLWS